MLEVEITPDPSLQLPITTHIHGVGPAHVAGKNYQTTEWPSDTVMNGR